jgi:hypothetical protein
VLSVIMLSAIELNVIMSIATITIAIILSDFMLNGALLSVKYAWCQYGNKYYAECCACHYK